MSVYSYKTILSKAKAIKKNVESEYKIGETSKWGYYIAKAILNPKKDITRIDFTTAKKSSGDNFGRQIYKSDYTDMAKRFVAYTEKHKQMPNNIKYKDMKMRVERNEKEYQALLQDADNDFKSSKTRRKERKDREKESNDREEGDDQDDREDGKVGGLFCVDG